MTLRKYFAILQLDAVSSVILRCLQLVMLQSLEKRTVLRFVTKCKQKHWEQWYECLVFSPVYEVAKHRTKCFGANSTLPKSHKEIYQF